MNINKNPIAENAIKEFLKERLKLDPQGGRVDELQLVLITRNMNSRIRNRGLSSKEIVYQRDQVSNLQKKFASDELLSDLQFNKRKESHNTPPTHKDIQYAVGDLVFLRNGKNKLKGREMFRIIHTYRQEGETWAKLQKNEDQFRSKSYDVKIAEVIPIKGFSTNQSSLPNSEDVLIKQYDHETEPTDVEQQSASQLTNCKSGQNTDNEEPSHLTTGTAYRRSRRKTAIQAEEKTRNLVAQGVLTLHTSSPKKHTPTHGWIWDEFSLLCDMVFDSDTGTVGNNLSNNSNCENDFNTMNDNTDLQPPGSSTSSTETVGEETTEELDRCWDHSREQYELMDDFCYDGEDLVFHSTRLEPSLPSSQPHHSVLGS